MLAPNEIYKVSRTALMAGVPGRNITEIVDNLAKRHMEAERREEEEQENDLAHIRVKMGDLQADGLSYAKAIGCRIEDHDDCVILYHPLLQFRFTVKRKGREVSAAFARFLAKCFKAKIRERDMRAQRAAEEAERQRKLAAAAEAAKRGETLVDPDAEPEPLDLVIPDDLAPTAVSHMTAYTIYKPMTTGRPYYILRAFDYSEAGSVARTEFKVNESLDALRKLVPAGSCCKPRRDEDDATIVETWI